MKIEEKLISLYLYIDECFKKQLFFHALRMSNNSQPDFTDVELVTVYLFGILKKRFEVKEIYNYTKEHWNCWFPSLPSYQAFNYRLNKLESIFPKLLERISETKIDDPNILYDIGLLDSFPIILAKSPRCDNAKVGKDEIANKGYCSSKKMYYHGVKVHILGNRVKDSIPIPHYIGLTPGGDNDLSVAETTIFPLCKDMEIYLDKAYIKKILAEELLTEQNVTLFMPVKKEKGQKKLDSADKLFSRAVSKIRQPIESLFHWIQQKTNIQFASKVRSTKGIYVHVFGKLTAAMLILLLGF